MTEITDNIEYISIDHMPEALRRFILHWGDLGGTWGVNRTVAQIHALLYVSESPLNAEQITQCLGVARSNVSNSLKELLLVGTIRRIPIAGDRRDYYEADTDVWGIAKKIARVRKAREIDPALETLTFCLDAAKGDSTISAEQRQRLQDMKDFTQTMDRWYGQMAHLPSKTLSRLVALGDRVVNVLNMGRKTSPR